MHLRLSENSLRCRLERDDVSRLLAREKLYCRLPMLTFTLEAIQCPDVLLRGIWGEQFWHLQVDDEALRTLAASLPTREGIEQRQGDLCLSLDIDVRRRT